MRFSMTALPLALPFLLAGGWGLFKSLRALVRGVRSRSWPETHGTIKSSRILKKHNADDQEVWREAVEYSYEVVGTRYRGTRIRFGGPPWAEWNRAEPKQRRPGDPVTVIFSTARPSVSALRRGYSPFVYIPLTAAAILAAIGLRMLA